MSVKRPVVAGKALKVIWERSVGGFGMTQVATELFEPDGLGATEEQITVEPWSTWIGMSGAIPVLTVFVSVTSTTAGTVTSSARPLWLLETEIDIDTGAGETEIDWAAEVEVATSLSPL